MKERRHLLPRLGTVLIVTALFSLVVAPAFAAPPTGKHFASVLMIANPDNGEIDAAPGCLSFTKGEMCTEFDDCGTWEFVAKNGHQNEWSGSLDFLNEDGSVVHAELRGITERFGIGDSIGGTLVATIEGVQVNASFAGVRVTKSACLEFGLSDDQ